MSLKLRSFSVRARQSFFAVAACATLCAFSPLADASTFSADFEGPEQTFHASLDLVGSLSAVGGIKTGSGVTEKNYVLTPPTDHPLVLFGYDGDGNPVFGAIAADSNPVSVGLPKIDAPSRFDHVEAGEDVFVYFDPKTNNPLLDGDGNPLIFTVTGGVPSVAPPAVYDLPNTRFELDAGGTHVQNITDLDLDAFNGLTVPFGIDTVHILTTAPNPPLKDITLDVTAALQGLTFMQTGSPILNPTGPNTGTFLVPGELGASIGSFDILALGLLNIGVDDQHLTQQLNLTGTYTVTDPDLSDNPQHRRHIKLDGGTNLSLPLSLSSVLSYNLTGLFEITTTVALAASITVDVAYHLESFLTPVPEPGSIVLLAIGALGGVAMVLRKRNV